MLRKFLFNFSKSKTFLRTELLQNPEFERAFPHLKQFMPKTYIKPKSEEYDYIESLEYHKKYPEPLHHDDLEIEQRKRFIEGYQNPEGPLKWMDEKEKLRIHSLIDVKLEELEATGLSREEILYDNGKKGISLRIDPFFQLIKRNHLAREILLKPGETLNVNKIVDLALKQDIGIDPNIGNIKNELYKDEILERLKKSRAIKSQGRHENKDFERSKEYFAAETYPQKEKLKEMLNKNIDYHYKPLSYKQIRKKNIRNINWLDIHWRNTQLLSKFLNQSGKIVNKFQSRLPSNQQRKIAKTIRSSRNMLLLPNNSFVKPSDKRSLKTIQEDIEDYCRHAINIETGHIYKKSLEKQIPEEQELKEFLDEIPRDFNEKRFENLKDIEFAHMPFMPNEKDLNLLEASTYAQKLKEIELFKEGRDVQKLKSERNESSIAKNPILSKLKEEKEEQREKNIEKNKESFEEMQLKFKNMSPLEITEAFLAEKSCDYKKLESIVQKYKKITEIKSNLSIRDQLKMLSEIKKSIGITMKHNSEDKKTLESMIHNFELAYKETEILKNFLEN